MTSPVVFGALWVIVAAITAFLPMRWQVVPGLALLVVAPVLIVWLWLDYGWFVAVIAVLGFGSMFRNPLIYFYRRARGETPEIPK